MLEIIARESPTHTYLRNSFIITKESLEISEGKLNILEKYLIIQEKPLKYLRESPKISEGKLIESQTNLKISKERSYFRDIIH